MAECCWTFLHRWIRASQQKVSAGKGTSTGDAVDCGLREDVVLAQGLLDTVACAMQAQAEAAHPKGPLVCVGPVASGEAKQELVDPCLGESVVFAVDVREVMASDMHPQAEAAESKGTSGCACSMELGGGTKVATPLAQEKVADGVIDGVMGEKPMPAQDVPEFVVDSMQAQAQVADPDCVGLVDLSERTELASPRTQGGATHDVVHLGFPGKGLHAKNVGEAVVCQAQPRVQAAETEARSGCVSPVELKRSTSIRVQVRPEQFANAASSRALRVDAAPAQGLPQAFLAELDGCPNGLYLADSSVDRQMSIAVRQGKTSQDFASRRGGDAPAKDQCRDAPANDQSRPDAHATHAWGLVAVPGSRVDAFEQSGVQGLGGFMPVTELSVMGSVLEAQAIPKLPDPCPDIIIQLSREGVYSARRQARSLLEKGSMQECVRWYSKAIWVVHVEKPAHVSAVMCSLLYSDRAEAYLKMREWEKAIHDCTAALALSQSTKALYRRAMAHYECGNDEDAWSDITAMLNIQQWDDSFAEGEQLQKKILARIKDAQRSAVAITTTCRRQICA